MEDGIRKQGKIRTVSWLAFKWKAHDTQGLDVTYNLLLKISATFRAGEATLECHGNTDRRSPLCSADDGSATPGSVPAEY